ncbi:SPOR domain-containing protein [Pseudocolwellia agarivorans]|mgnify:CR=1 FL=1|uniref:SPOR domain-containing protein n=1 Tax=Pseudocolwellia agarivorans TaxID=1911682 RepID=UPI0009844AD7|nr:SPOR domain-containing protein [Pseudocolwellia agarivorans]
MSTPFQNRIVGTVIVAAVAIIFLPDLLDGNKKKYNAEFENIPQAPKIDLNVPAKSFPTEKLKVIAPKEEQVVEVEQDNLLQFPANESVESDGSKNETAQNSPVLSNDIVKVNKLTKPDTLDKKVVKKEDVAIKKAETSSLPKKINVKETWVIQLGSFRHKKNVVELIEKLKYHGYTTFTRPINTKNGTLTKVFVGPDINKTSLENKIKPLKALTHVEGKVTRFYPTK